MISWTAGQTFTTSLPDPKPRQCLDHEPSPKKETEEEEKSRKRNPQKISKCSNRHNELGPLPNTKDRCPDDRRVYGQYHPSAAATERLLLTSVAPTPMLTFNIAEEVTGRLSSRWAPINLPFTLMRDQPAPPSDFGHSFRFLHKRGDHSRPLSWSLMLGPSKLYLSHISPGLTRRLCEIQCRILVIRHQPQLSQSSSSPLYHPLLYP